jgi:hypothetical protein
MSNTKRNALVAGLLAVIAALAAPPAQAQTELRYRFKEGEKLAFVQDQKMKMTMNPMGQDIEMQTSQTSDITWTILGVEKDGKAKLTLRFDRIRFSMDGPTGKFEYDSKDDKEPDDPVGKVLAPIFRATTGADFTLTMDTRGRTSDIKVPEKVSDTIKNLQGGAALAGGFGEEGLKRMVDQGYLVLPEGPVTKGKSWESKTEAKAPFGKITMDNTCTYEGPTTEGDRKLEKVALKPKMTLDADPAAAFTLNLKEQDAKGTALFDNNAGRLVESSVTQKMEMEITVNGQTITQKSETTVTLKLREKAK